MPSITCSTVFRALFFRTRISARLQPLQTSTRREIFRCRCGINTEMKFTIRILFIVVLGTLCCPQITQRSAQSAESVNRDEVRALWVVRTTLTSPEKIRQLVSSAADNGFNTLIVQIRGRGDAYYKSRVEPRAAELKDQPPDFDPLSFTLTEAHARGLKVHGWLNTSLLANLDALPTDPHHVYNKHPEWLAVPKPVAAE